MIDDQLSKEDREAIRRENAARIGRAFRSVFGVDGGRTEQQKLVWENLEKMSFHRRATFVPDEGGRFDAIQGALCEGYRQLFLQILAIVEKNPDEPKPKPESIR